MTAPLRKDFIEVRAGDRLKFDVEANGGLLVSHVTCTVKRYASEADPGLGQVSSDAGDGIDVASDTECTVTFGSDVTEDWPPGKLRYDVQADPNATESYTVQHGWMDVVARPTRTRSTEYVIGAPLLTSAPVFYSLANAQLTGFVVAAPLLTSTPVFPVPIAVPPPQTVTAPLFTSTAVYPTPLAVPPPSSITAPLLTSTPVFPAARAEHSLSALGADLLNHWEVPASGSALITLNGSNVSQLNDRASGAKHLTQGTPGNQPEYQATGGPNNQPYINIQGTTRYVSHVTLGHAAGKRLGVYAVYAIPSTGSATRFQWSVDNTAGSDTPAAMYQHTDNNYRAYAKGNAVAGQAIAITNPATSSNFVKGSIEYLSTGLECRINGSLTTANFTGNATADSAGRAFMGYNTSAAGKVCMLVIVDNIDTAKRAIVDAYILSRYGL